MKKLIFSMLLILVASITMKAQEVGQIDTISDQKIWSIIQKSKEVNSLENGITDPNFILPGQNLTFLFESGNYTTIKVKAGDNQWTIAKKILSLEKKYGPVIEYEEPTPTIHDIIEPNKPIESKTFPWFWLFFIFLLISLIFAIYKIWERSWKDKDPIDSGTPVVEGGINPDQTNEISQRIREIAATQSGSTLSGITIISPIEYGLLNGIGKVYYKGEGFKRRKFNETPGYRATVRFENGEEKVVYFLQGCGNDVTFNGNWIEDVIFTPQRELVPAPTEQGNADHLNDGADTVAPINSEEDQPQFSAKEVIEIINQLQESGGKINVEGNLEIDIPTPPTDPKI